MNPPALPPLDVMIEISGINGVDGYDVLVRCPRGAEAASRMRLPVTNAELEVLVDGVRQAVLTSAAPRRRLVNEQERTVQEFGGMLYDALVQGNVRGLLTSVREEARRDGRGIRFVLQVRPRELARLPWEFLFDAEEDEYLCLNFPVIRRPTVPRSTVPPRMNVPLRILGMVARPDESPALAIEEEQKRLAHALAGLIGAGLVELHWVPGQGWRDLQQATRHGPWHVFHFIGHGGFDDSAGEGFIALRDDNGRTKTLLASQLATLLRSELLQLVVLNACETGSNTSLDPFSSVAGALVRRDIPAVLAMQFEITDTAAIELSRTFYGTLAERQPVDAAVTDARKAMWMANQGTLEWGTPVLFLRSDGDLLPPAEPERRGLAAGRAVWAVRFSASGERVAFAAGREVTVLEPDRDGSPLVVRHARLSAVAAVAFSPDGRWLASAGDDKTARVWEVAAGKEMLRLHLHHWVNAVSFSPDGQHLATAGDDGTVRVWSLAAGEPVTVLRHDGPVRAVVYGPGGSLASGADDGSARVWDLPGGECVREVRHDGPVRAVAFDAHDRLVSAGDDGTVRGWEAAGSATAYRLVHEDPVLAVATGGAGTIATASGNRVLLWDPAGHTERAVLRHESPVYGVALNPAGTRVVAGTAAGCDLWVLPGGASWPSE